MKYRSFPALFILPIVCLLVAGCLSTSYSAEEPIEAPEEGFASPAEQENPAYSLSEEPAQTAEERSETFQIAYPIVDTGQTDCYNASQQIACPEEGNPFYGQDAQLSGNPPQYFSNTDGTVTDLVTGLTWTQSPDLNGDGEIDSQDKLTQAEAAQMVEDYTIAGYDDWRLPTIKELYSLIDFSGVTGSLPYIDTDYFQFGYGDTSAGERDLDAQFATSTIYVSTVFDNQKAMFGVNLADGRIKGYPVGAASHLREEKTFYVLFVRGNPDYGVNDFIDNANGTITDQATGLTWMQADNGEGVVWEEALSYCASLNLAGISEWRLPDAKELQSIVDYSRSPDTTRSAAIDPLFDVSILNNGINNSGEVNYPFFWTSTTHLDGIKLGSRAVYISFGEARGFMNGRLMDVHGAGAQRSDPKSGAPALFSDGFGPQGDVIGIYNYVRCVSGDSALGVQEKALPSQRFLPGSQPVCRIHTPAGDGWKRS